MNAQIKSLLGKKLSDIRGMEIFRNILMPDVEEIGDESYLELPLLGISMVLPDGETISAVHLHAFGHEGYSEFQGELPAGIVFAMSREAARDRLGNPAQCGDGGRVLLLGPRPAWDAFIVDGQRLHLEYSEDNQSVRLITISEATV
jgi:hypothetical protein